MCVKRISKQIKTYKQLWKPSYISSAQHKRRDAQTPVAVDFALSKPRSSPSYY